MDQRKRVELRAKLGSISSELRHWAAASEPGGRLQKHHSQIRRVALELQPLADRVSWSIARDDMSDKWLDLEGQVLDLHRVWGFFRDKLILRQLDEFAPYLLLADEFAWACYEPAQQAAVAAKTVPLSAVREPPLIYLAATASPFSVSKGGTYGTGLQADTLSSRAARLLVERLPLSVIGIPWFQLRHLPEALVIGHEVGHLILHELVGLDKVTALVTAALPPTTSMDDRRNWIDWAEESFADVYGALCGGSAYLDVLTDFLGGSNGSRSLQDRWYPPVPQRLRLVEEALKAVNTAIPPITDVAAEKAVAWALVAGPYTAFGDEVPRLDQVINPGEQNATGNQPRDLLRGWEPETRDIRTLLAITAQAFRQSPECYEASPARDRVLERAARIQQPGTRYLGGGQGVDRAEIDRADAAGIDELYELLTASRTA